MKERYITIEQLRPGQKIVIENKEYRAKEDGVLLITESMIFPTEFGVSDFEQVIMQLLNSTQQIKIFTLWGNSSRIMIKDTIRMVDGNKELAKQLLDMGCDYGVLSRTFNSAYKVNSREAKERMLLVANHIKEELENKPKMGVQQILDVIKSGTSPLVESKEQEETIHDPDSDESVLASIQKSNQKSPVIPLQRKSQEIPKKKSVPPSFASQTKKPHKPLKK